MKKNIKLDMTQIKEALQKLSFLKSYAFLLPSVIIIVVAILIYLPTPIMNRNLQQKIQKESITKGNSLATLGKEIISKDQWIEEKKLSDAYLLDVGQASELALQAGQRELLSYDMFPAPKDTSVTIFKQFGQTFQTKLEDLVKAADGGDRPTDNELGLSSGSGRTSVRNVAGSTEQISDKISRALSLKRAQSISFYVSVYDLMFYNYWSINKSSTTQKQGNVFDYSGVGPAVEACWYTQIGYWIIEDVIATIKAVNSGSSNGVYTSVVKRLIDFNFGLVGDSQRISGAKVLPEYVISSQDSYGERSQNEGQATLTGHSSKDGIDVVHFNMSLVIDSEKMMDFMKELCSAKKHSFAGFDGQAAKRNFKHNQITILDADFEIIDRDAVENKYYRYGDAAVVELVISCEYVFNKKSYFDIKPVTIKNLLNEEIETGNIENEKENPEF